MCMSEKNPVFMFKRCFTCCKDFSRTTSAINPASAVLDGNGQRQETSGHAVTITIYTCKTLTIYSATLVVLIIIFLCHHQIGGIFFTFTT